MDYRETYNNLKKQVTEEITAIAKQYDEMHAMGMDGMTIYRPGVLDDYELTEMWYSEEYGDVVFTDEDGDQSFLDNYDLDTRIDILTFLKGNSMMAEQTEPEHEGYQVFSEGDGHVLHVDHADTLAEAKALYEEKQGFMLMGVDAPTCFDVIYARPYGMALIS